MVLIKIYRHEMMNENTLMRASIIYLLTYVGLVDYMLIIAFPHL